MGFALERLSKGVALNERFLQRDGAPKPHVRRLVDRTHTTLTKWPEDSISILEDGAGFEHWTGPNWPVAIMHDGTRRSMRD